MKSKLPPEGSIGFTGTRDGMSAPQTIMVSQFLMELNPAEAHHGDCIGADAQFHDLIVNNNMAVKIVIHPSDHRLRAYRLGNESWDPKDPLERNRDIVACADVMIAAPKNKKSRIETPGGGGTWFTINASLKAKKRVVIVYPDGMYEWR